MKYVVGRAETTIRRLHVDSRPKSAPVKQLMVKGSRYQNILQLIANTLTFAAKSLEQERPGRPGELPVGRRLALHQKLRPGSDGRPGPAPRLRSPHQNAGQRPAPQ
jgi:hypothetical protein